MLSSLGEPDLTIPRTWSLFPPPVHKVGEDRAPVGVGSAPEDAQIKGIKMVYVSLGVGVGVRIEVGVQLYKWCRRLAIHW
jgi:hypothetical protein